MTLESRAMTQAMIKAAVSELRTLFQESPQSSNVTNGDYGETMKRSLVEAGHYEYFDRVGSERSVLSEEEVAAAKEIKAEDALVAYMTPFFQRVCSEVDEGMSFVNSETIAWLPTSSQNKRRYLKPDFTIIHRAMVSLQERPGECLFGSPELDAIEAMRVVGEAKIILGEEGFGELCRYTVITAQRFGSTVRGIGFGPSTFILVESNSSAPFKATEGSLCTPGSFELIKKFIDRDDPLTKSFALLCNALGVREHHVSSGRKARSFLGKGRSGRAFVVTRPDNSDISVLKVVFSTEGFEKTNQEFRRLENAGKESPDHVVRVRVGSFCDGEFLIGSIKYFYCGYLMDEVGRPTQSGDLNDVSRERICRSLNDLHRDNVHHGDARVPNVVDCNGRFKWIDLHHRVSPLRDIALTYDVKMLFDSMLSPCPVEWGALSPHLRQYSETANVDSMLEMLRIISSMRRE